MVSTVLLIILRGMCRFLRISMLCVWIAPRTLAMMMTRGLTFQPWVFIAVMRQLYLSCVVLMAWSVYLSCVNVNPIIWIVRLGECMNGVFVLAWHLVHIQCFGQNYTRHVHFVVGHEQCKIYDGMVLSCGWSPLFACICESIMSHVCT